MHLWGVARVVDTLEGKALGDYPGVLHRVDTLGVECVAIAAVCLSERIFWWYPPGITKTYGV